MRYSQDLRERVCKEFLANSGISLQLLSQRYGVSVATLSRWRQNTLKIVGRPSNPSVSSQMTSSTPPQRTPERWSHREKLVFVVQSLSLNDEALTVLPRAKGSSKNKLLIKG